jgi:release factor glutamine methyltransferase
MGMTCNELYRDIINRFTPELGQREAAHVAKWVLSHYIPDIQPALIVASTGQVSESALRKIQSAVHRVSAGEPVQYVLEEAWFDGLRLRVTPAVLVPRPETEELAILAAGLVSETGTLLDVGTGSGCIAVALKHRLPQSEVWAVDISEAALAIARENAGAHHLEIHFRQIDVLASSQWAALPKVDAIISNPPYIPQAEQLQMSPTVVQHEPHVALFVPDGDPLLFYRSLAALGWAVLKPGGPLLAETHEALAGSTGEIFRHAGYREVQIHKDMQDKERFISAIRP